jgi:hypothetical protein
VELIGKTWIEPVPCEHAIEGYTETLRPVLRREPLAANNYNVGLALYYSERPGTHATSLTSSVGATSSPAPAIRPRIRATQASVSGMSGTHRHLSTAAGPAL